MSDIKMFTSSNELNGYSISKPGIGEDHGVLLGMETTKKYRYKLTRPGLLLEETLVSETLNACEIRLYIIGDLTTVRDEEIMLWVHTKLNSTSQEPRGIESLRIIKSDGNKILEYVYGDSKYVFTVRLSGKSTILKYVSSELNEVVYNGLCIPFMGLELPAGHIVTDGNKEGRVLFRDYPEDQIVNCFYEVNNRIYSPIELTTVKRLYTSEKGDIIRVSFDKTTFVSVVDVIYLSVDVSELVLQDGNTVPIGTREVEEFVTVDPDAFSVTYRSVTDI